MRFGRERDCEYSEKDQRTRTEVLEERIAVLKARITELEDAAGGAAQPSEFTSWSGLLDDVDFAGLAVTSHDPERTGGSSPGRHDFDVSQYNFLEPLSDLSARSHGAPSYAEAQAL